MSLIKNWAEVVMVEIPMGLLGKLQREMRGNGRDVYSIDEILKSDHC